MNEADYRKEQGEPENRCPHGVAFDQPENDCPACAEAYANQKRLEFDAQHQLLEASA